MLRPSLVADLAAELGARVFPLRPESKRPAIKGWPQLATSDRLTILEWGMMFRNCWWGAVMDGLLCLDFDRIRGDRDLLSRGALPSLQRFFEEIGSDAFPREAYHQMTRSGGAHLVARAPADIQQYGARLRDYGVDVKCGPAAMIVLAAPGYRYLGGTFSLRPADLPEWPERVLEAVRERRQGCWAQRHTVAPGEAWHAAVAGSQNGLGHPFRAGIKTKRLMLEDCRRLAHSPGGEQEATLTFLGHKWGNRVARGFVGAEEVLRKLSAAASNMENTDASNPWTPAAIEDKLRRAIGRGYVSERADEEPLTRSPTHSKLCHR